MNRKIAVLTALMILLCISGCCQAVPETVGEKSAPTPEAEPSAAAPAASPTAAEPSSWPEPTSGARTYDVKASVKDGMPKYRFVANGVANGTDDWGFGYVYGLDIYDEAGESLLSKDFSEIQEGEKIGYHVYNQMMDTMGLHVVDVNFDGYRDVIILSVFAGAHSNTWYDCWLWDPETTSFTACKSFSGICNPALDSEKQCIFSAGGGGAAFWGGSIYRFIDGAFVVTNDLYTGWDGLVETELTDGQMRVVREVSYGEEENKTGIVEREQAYYKDSPLWELDHPHWYWSGGHHADEWLE